MMLPGKLMLEQQEYARSAKNEISVLSTTNRDNRIKPDNIQGQYTNELVNTNPCLQPGYYG